MYSHVTGIVPPACLEISLQAFSMQEKFKSKFNCNFWMQVPYWFSFQKTLIMPFSTKHRLNWQNCGMVREEEMSGIKEASFFKIWQLCTRSCITEGNWWDCLQHIKGKSSKSWGFCDESLSTQGWLDSWPWHSSWISSWNVVSVQWAIPAETVRNGHMNQMTLDKLLKINVRWKRDWTQVKS